MLKLDVFLISYRKRPIMIN